MASIPFPLEIVIEATPISPQGSASSKEAWRQAVADSARLRLRDLFDWYWLDERATAVTILYFPIARMQGDVDNIVKPILDGMKSVVYPDDRLVERLLVQRFEPGVPWSFSAPTGQLGLALDRPPPVVYIRIDDDLSWRRIG
jgi:crossover junction endodeoxyribonuclease RusA